MQNLLTMVLQPGSFGRWTAWRVEKPVLWPPTPWKPASSRLWMDKRLFVWMKYAQQLRVKWQSETLTEPELTPSDCSMTCETLTPWHHLFMIYAEQTAYRNRWEVSALIRIVMPVIAAHYIAKSLTFPRTPIKRKVYVFVGAPCYSGIYSRWIPTGQNPKVVQLGQIHIIIFHMFKKLTLSSLTFLK